MSDFDNMFDDDPFGSGSMELDGSSGWDMGGSGIDDEFNFDDQGLGLDDEFLGTPSGPSMNSRGNQTINNQFNSGGSQNNNSAGSNQGADVQINSFGTEDLDGDQDDAFEDSGNDKKELMRNAIILIVAGVVILIVGFGVFGIIRNVKAKNTGGNQGVIVSGSSDAGVNNDYATSGDGYFTSDNYGSTSDNYGSTSQNQSNVSSVNGKNNWNKFEKTNEIVFNTEPVNLKFTVTKVENYVMNASQGHEIVVKTIATGALSGFAGSYEIELPYDKGSLLSPGAELMVSVQVGEYKGMSVVGEMVVI